jgi:hypothetical protein
LLEAADTLAAGTDAAAPVPVDPGAQADPDTPETPSVSGAMEQALAATVERTGRTVMKLAAVPPPWGRMAAIRDGVRKSSGRARAAVTYLADRVIEVAPRVPVRDLATLRKQFPGLTPEELADRLVAGAVNGTSTVGAGIGAAAMLPVPLAMPTELAAEMTGVAVIELKLIAELHEVYGRRPSGGLKERSVAYLTSWSDERGVDVTKPWTVNTALGVQMKRELRQQITKRLLRNLPSLTPFMVGAAVGAVMNRRDTRKLAERVRGDLRRHQVAWGDIPILPPLEEPQDALPLATLPGERAAELPEDRAEPRGDRAESQGHRAESQGDRAEPGEPGTETR